MHTDPALTDLTIKKNTKQDITLNLRRNEGGLVITKLEYLTEPGTGEERQEGKAYLNEVA